MTPERAQILTAEQLAQYEERGFVQSIPVLSQDEVQLYRGEVERTCEALGGGVTRLDNAHRYFRWAWDLSTSPRILDCMEDLFGPNILLKSTRLFYKRGQSAAYVGWHQDGYTERLTSGGAPAIWLGLTVATVENGCLRVVPRSHRGQLLAHESDPSRVMSNGTTAPLTSPEVGHELSGRVAAFPPDVAKPHDIVMASGEMSFHHPLLLHGSNPNLATEPRIGLSATYSAPALYKNDRPVAWVRGNDQADYLFAVLDEPPMASFEEAVAAYRSYAGI